MIPRFHARALCAALFIIAGSAGVAAARETPAPSPSPSAPPEIAHVVTSDRSDESIDRVARTTFVITKEEIVRHGYRSIADAIATLPGVNLVRYGTTGSAASFGIRGSSTSQVLVLVNGLPAAGSQINNLDLNSIPTTGVERIEVVEGGGSTLYGADSVGGVINVIATPLAGKAILDAFAGSFGTRGASLETRNFSFSRTIARNDFGLPGNGERPNSDSAQTTARVAFDRHFGRIRAAFDASVSDHHLGVPGPDGFLSATSRENDVDTGAHLAFARTGARATTTLDLGGTHQSFVYTCDTPVDSSCPNYPFTAGAPIPPPYAQLLTEGRVEANFRNVLSSDRTRTVYGIDLSRGVARVDDGSSPLQVHGFARTAIYVQQNWLARTGSRFYAGVRAERDGAQGGAFSPSIGGILRLSPQLSLKANAATAFRAPNASDLYYPGFSNPNLQVERTRVADVSLVDRGLLGGATLTWFTTTGRNLIVLDQTYTPQNVGHAAIAGLTFAIRTVPIRGYYAKLNLTNLYRERDLDSDPAIDIYSGKRLPNRGPVLAANLELGFLGRPASAIESAAITMRTAGARGPVDSRLPLFDQPATYSNLGAFVRFRLDRDALLTLRASNLGNERYAEIGGYPMPGRSFVVELSTR
ncbi:MAG TPA: TonB-dependent receptor [Candidatus Baltobacteraceae bacterium]